MLSEVVEAAHSGVPSWLQDAAIVVGILFGAVLLAVGSYYVVKARKSSAAEALADSAVASLTGEVTALRSQCDRLTHDHSHCLELNRELSGRVDTLEHFVTARDLVHGLATMTRDGFIALGVDSAKVPMPESEHRRRP